MKMIIAIMSFALTMGSAHALQSFESDGCSMYPDGTFREPKIWAHCCYVHDIHYWMGGTRKERELADEELKSCLAKTTYLTHAQIVELAVRAGGAPYSIWPWRWGFGHEEIRPYGPLSSEEASEVSLKLETILTELERWSPEFKNHQINYVEQAYRELERYFQNSLK